MTMNLFTCMSHLEMLKLNFALNQKSFLLRIVV